MVLFANKYRIETARLKGWDYSNLGYYFVAICTKDRRCCLADVINGRIKLSKYGKIVQQCWHDLTNHYFNISVGEFVVMPNHIHGIVVFEKRVGVGGPGGDDGGGGRDGACPVSTNQNAHTLGNVIGSFKSAVSKQIHKIDPNFAWQSRFYDHIIRDENSLARIRQYIIDNPKNWEDDRNNPKNFIKKQVCVNLRG